MQLNPIHKELDCQGRLASLVRAATAGDQQAWASLVARFTPMLRAVVRGYRLSAADVDDVVQTAWVSAFSHIGALREAAAIGGWLCVIARREAVRALDQRRREIPVDEPRFPDENESSTPESALLEAEQHRTVQEAVERLPGRQSRLLAALLRDSATSYTDVSRKLDIPVGSIGPTRERALARLRRDRLLLTTLS